VAIRAKKFQVVWIPVVYEMNVHLSSDEVFVLRSLLTTIMVDVMKNKVEPIGMTTG
jgi:hypothetical protein